jgi:hypothetical protein
MSSVTRTRCVDAARVVPAARRGDRRAQVALARLGAAARRGVPRAVQAFHRVREYIERHPVVPVRLTLARGTIRCAFVGARVRPVQRATRRTRRVARAARIGVTGADDGPAPTHAAGAR